MSSQHALRGISNPPKCCGPRSGLCKRFHKNVQTCSSRLCKRFHRYYAEAHPKSRAFPNIFPLCLFLGRAARYKVPFGGSEACARYRPAAARNEDPGSCAARPRLDCHRFPYHQQPFPGLIQQVLVHLGGHDGHALHFALQHAAYAQRHTRGIVVRGAHQNLVAILNGDVLEAFDELREERTCDVRYDQPEDAAASGHQRARLRVGVVAQLLDDFPDPLSGLRVSLPTGMCPWCFSTQAIAGEGISKVVVDYAMGVNEAMDHLMSLGHRRIGFISGPWALKSARIRRTAFLRSLST